MDEGAEVKITRRQFLRAGTLLPLVGVGVFVDAAAEEAGLIGEGKQRYLVELPGGKKVGIILGSHETLRDEPSTPISSSDLYAPVGGVALDAHFDYLNPANVEGAPALLNELKASGPFFGGAIEAAVGAKAPVLLADIILKEGEAGFADAVTSGARRNLIMAGSSVLATGFVVPAGEIVARVAEKLLGKRIDRRNFTKWLMAAGFAGTTHFSMPNLIGIVRGVGGDPSSEIGKDILDFLADGLHPEKWALTMRNILIALKVHDLMRDDGLGKEIFRQDSVLNLIYGQKHRSLRFFLRHPDFARDYWHFAGYDKVMREICGDKIACAHTSCVVDMVNQKAWVINHKKLEDLVQP